MTTDDYNNVCILQLALRRQAMATNSCRQGTTIQLVCFLAAEFPVQFLTKRYGFKTVLPTVSSCSLSGPSLPLFVANCGLDDVWLGRGL